MNGCENCKKVEKELGEIKAEAKSLREQLDRNLSSSYTTAHQLRSPLIGIQSIVERLQKAEKLSVKGDKYLLKILDYLKRLLMLIDSLLSAARLDSNKVVIHKAPLDLVTFIGDYLKTLDPVVEVKDIELLFKNYPESLKMNTDQLALTNVLQSLISNAIEYTPAGGSIEVGISRQDDNALVTVSDTGIGIPENEFDDVFKKFVRGSNAVLFKQEGTGLGLYIADQVVRLMGGRLDLRSSTNPGNHGTTFTISIPIN